MTKPPKARSQGEKKSADDHADLSGVPDGFKGLGVLPILVDLAPVVVVVGVGDVVALVGVIAADQDGVVVADQALLGALDVVGPIVGGGPPQGHVAHHAVARQQLPLQVSDGGPAEIGAGVVAAAVGVGILRKLGRVDGGITVSGLDYIEEEEERKEIAEQIENMLCSLTGRQREAIYLRYMQELEYDEIAVLLNLTTKGTRKLIYRAIERMREQYGPVLFYFFLSDHFFSF